MTANQEEFHADFSITVPADDADADDFDVTGVSGSQQMISAEREGIHETQSTMDVRGPRRW